MKSKLTITNPPRYQLMRFYLSRYMPSLAIESKTHCEPRDVLTTYRHTWAVATAGRCLTATGDSLTRDVTWNVNFSLKNVYNESIVIQSGSSFVNWVVPQWTTWFSPPRAINFFESIFIDRKYQRNIDVMFRIRVGVCLKKKFYWLSFHSWYDTLEFVQCFLIRHAFGIDF